MKVRMLFGPFVPDGGRLKELASDEVHDLPTDQAKGLIEQGRAESLEPTKPTKEKA